MGLCDDVASPAEETMTPKPLAIRASIARQLADAVLNLAGRVPASAVAASDDPVHKANAITFAACKKAAAISAGLAMPPGPWGLVTVIPDLAIIWDLQAKMVADIAAAYGQTASLSREHMLWCLFKHTGAQAFRDFVVRSGERWLVQKASLSVLQSAAQAIGVNLTQRTIGKGISRFMPIIGAVGVGVYAYRDTREVASIAIDMFSKMQADETMQPVSDVLRSPTVAS
jgi:hypothetical protein